jgi:hypothetical protein
MRIPRAALSAPMLALALSFAAFPFFVFAHEEGLSFEKVVGAYKVDVGYEEATAGEAAVFDFELFNAKTEDPQPFDNVWVRATKGGTTVFAGPIAAEHFGKPGFSLMFSEAGSYMLSVRYVKGSETLAEAEFPFTIAQTDAPKAGQARPSTGIWTIALCIAFGAGYLVRKMTTVR